MGSEEQDVQDRSRGQARDTDASEAFVEQWYLRSEVSVIRWRIEALVGHRKGLARRTWATRWALSRRPFGEDRRSNSYSTYSRMNYQFIYIIL